MPSLLTPFLRKREQGKSRSEEEQLLEKYPDHDSKKGATILATCINLLKNMVGAGLLNVCVAFKYASVIGGLVDMVISAFLCTCGFLLIGYCCSKTGARTFRTLMTITLGEGSGKLMDVILFFHTLFSCVGYVTLIGDFTTKSCQGLFPNSLFAESRLYASLMIVTFIIFPLCLVRDLGPLKYTSAFGLAAIAFSVCYVFYEHYASAEEHQYHQHLKDNLWYIKFETFKTLALFNGSFSAHYNAPTYYAELRQKSFARFAKVTLYSFGISMVLFTVFGLVGFARWGDEVKGNVLKSYSPDDVFVQISWMCMNVSTIFVFPLAFQRMRASWTALVNKPRGLTSSMKVPFTTMFLLGLSTYLGVAFTDIAVIKMIKGATLGVSIMFIMPGLAYLGISRKEKKFIDPWGPGGGALFRQVSPTKEIMKHEPVILLRACSYLLIAVGIAQGLFALLSHYKII